MLQAADLTIRMNRADDVVIARVEIPAGTALLKEGNVRLAICFTTGRGSAYGCKPAPSLKLATNTALFEHQEEDMDINCGTIVDGKETVEEVGRRFFDLILRTASGEKTKSELFGYGEDEFAPWIVGATM